MDDPDRPYPVVLNRVMDPATLDGVESAHVLIVQNWFEELKRLLPFER
jgi:hypothetical protein